MTPLRAFGSLFLIPFLVVASESNGSVLVESSDDAKPSSTARIDSKFGENEVETITVIWERLEDEELPSAKATDSLDDLLDIWNPVTIGNIWEYQNNEIDVSGNCYHDISEYLAGLRKSEIWANKMMNADGKHAWGFFWGGKYWVGSPDLCRDIDYQARDGAGIVRDGYEIGGIPPFRVSVNSVHLTLDVLRPGFDGARNITLGLCLPARCTVEDVRKLLNYSTTSIKHLPRKVQVTKVRNLSEGYSLFEDSTFYILLVTSAAVVGLVALGTCYDVALRYKFLRSDVNRQSHGAIDDGKEARLGKNNPDEEITISKLWSVKEHNGSFDVREQKNLPKPLSEALLSFSLFLNISKLASLDVGNDTLAPIHGLRVVSMLWVILVHTCLVTNELSDSPMLRAEVEKDFLYQTISNGTYAVDTFFFISGCLVSFLYFRTIAKERMRELQIVKGCCGQFMQFLGMMAYRYWRLTPIYLLVIGLVQVSMKWYQDHLVITLTTLDQDTCEKFWWRNALYVNTYFPMDDRCMVWSWYLANDTQFYTIGIIILITSASFFNVGALMTGLFLVVSWIVTAIVTVKTEHVPTIEDPFAHYESLYDKPWTRIGPYLIGMATGWFLFKNKCKMQINKVTLALGWFISLGSMLSIVYGLYGDIRSPVLATIYTTLSHSGWALSLAWVLIACITGHGGLVNSFLSWKYIYPISRLTYCAYLIHPVLMRGIVLQGESPIHLTRGIMATMFLGFTVSTYAVSLVLSLLFEAPMVSMLRIVHPLRRWKSDRPCE